MKALILTTLLLPVTTFAAPKNETLHATATVSVADLRCVKFAGEHQVPFTKLGEGGAPVILNRAKLIQLKHGEFSGDGCHEAELNEISLRANQFFGFQYGVPMTVVRAISESSLFQGRCVAVIKETVELELGPQTKLGSTDQLIVPADDCE